MVVVASEKRRIAYFRGLSFAHWNISRWHLSSEFNNTAWKITSKLAIAKTWYVESCIFWTNRKRDSILKQDKNLEAVEST